MRPSSDRDRPSSIPLWVSLPALALLTVVGGALVWANRDNTPAPATAAGEPGGIERFDERVARPPARADLEANAPRVWDILPGDLHSFREGEMPAKKPA